MAFRERLPVLYVASATIYGAAGMWVGLYQHLTRDKKPIPFHSHLDSLGWLTLAAIGLILYTFPWARNHKLAIIQFIVLEIGCFLLLGGLPLVYLELTRIPIEVGAIMVPIGFSMFSFIMITGLLKAKPGQ